MSVEDLCTHLSNDPRCYAMPMPLAFRQSAAAGQRRDGRYHPESGSIYGFDHPNTFQCMKDHEYEAHRQHNVYYPFADRDEWELAKFLNDNLNQGQITRFLKLSWVSNLTVMYNISSNYLLGEVRSTETASIQISPATVHFYGRFAEGTEVALYDDSD